ncbi:MAG: (Fe-S)-binding protein, partial [Alphaproteobacteria bacterium]
MTAQSMGQSPPTPDRSERARQATHVALAVTCLVDLFRPRVGFAAVTLLEAAGCAVSVPDGQTCCGQPAQNAGRAADAADLARRAMALYGGFDAVVVPSGSCAGTMRRHYAGFFPAGSEERAAAQDLARRTYELSEFLALRGAAVRARFDGRVTLHDSCSCRRDMGLHGEPRQMLAGVAGLELCEIADGEECCGFGGTFAVKNPDVSLNMAGSKLDAAEATQ